MAIRPAVIDDIPSIHQLILALAEYEKASDQMIATPEDLASSFFSENPQVFCHVATEAGRIVGIAIWHLNYSTWLGKHGIYLEDLFVEETSRGEGHGLALLKELADICVRRNYERFQWWVLDWNKPSVDFYKSVGAVAMDEWTVFRLSGESLRTFAKANNP